MVVVGMRNQNGVDVRFTELPKRSAHRVRHIFRRSQIARIADDRPLLRRGDQHTVAMSD